MNLIQLRVSASAESLRQASRLDVEPLLKATEQEIQALSFAVRWGPRYDPEMILEHAVCHLLRHRGQLERW
jgi:uncharacterized damage-inducible protein DinB